MSFTARRGEIVGFFEVGAGRSELMKAAVRRRAPERGHVERTRAWHSAARATRWRAGPARRPRVCPEDRKQEGIVAIASVADNRTSARISARRGCSRRRANANSRNDIERLAIKTRDGDAPIGALSGGNQQKVVLARWLAERIDVFLMDEPTRGIDVGARAEIYNLFYELAEGRTVILVSSDLAEVIGVSDRSS